MRRLLIAVGFLLCAAAARVEGQGFAPKADDDVPRGHRPPPGMCRIWIDGVPPGQQPAPTDCATAVRERPANARVLFGSEAPRQRDECREGETRGAEKRDEKCKPPKSRKSRRERGGDEDHREVDEG
jgi:hypothetical protein